MIDEEQRWGKTLYVGFSPNHPNEYYLDNKERIQEILGELNSGYQQLTESLPKADKMAVGGRYFQVPLEEFLSSFKLGNWRPVEEINLIYNQPIQYGLDQVVYQVGKASRILNLWEDKSKEAWDKYHHQTNYDDRKNLTLDLFKKPDLPELKELIDNYDGKAVPNRHNEALSLRFKFESKKRDEDYLKNPQPLMEYLSEMKAQFQDLLALLPKPVSMRLHNNGGKTMPITCFDDLLRARIKEKYLPNKEIILQFQEPVLGSTKVTYELGYLKLLRWWEQVKGEQRCSSCPNYVPFHSGDSVWCSNPLGDVDAHCNKNKSMQINPCKIYDGDSNNHFLSVECIIQQFIG